MSPSSKTRKKGSKRIEVQDDLSHHPFAAALAGGIEPSEAAPDIQDAQPSDPKIESSPLDLRFASKVVLRREKKGRGGKTVTRIEGVQSTNEGLEALARSLGKALGARAFVENGQLLISGDQCQSAAKWLTKAGATKVVIGN